MKKAWIAFAATLVVVLPARIYAATQLLDGKTGFYTDGGRWIAVFSILLVLGAAAAVLFCPGKRGGNFAFGPVRNAGVAAVAALTGIFVLVQSVVGLASGYGGDNRIVYLVFSVLGLPAGGVILAAAYDFASGEAVLKKHPLLALIPSVWGCLLLVYLFVTYAAMVNLVENAYTTFTVVFLLLFLFTQAKLLAGVESKNSAGQIYPVGFTAVLLALVTAVPQCVLTFSAKDTVGALPAGLSMTAVVMAVYIFAYLSVQWRFRLPVEEIGTMSVHSEEKPSEPAESGDSLLKCSEFLTAAYEGREEFSQTARSPFLLRREIESAADPLN